MRATSLVTLLLAGCSLLHHPPTLPEPVNLIAVMPIEREENATPAESGERIAPEAERVMTAQVYDVLSSSPRWRFVPDLTVRQALNGLKSDGDLASRARALGKAVNADAVLCGTVSRYIERVGTEYGARQPAAVGITLQLVSVQSGSVLWKNSFDQRQQALSANLFNWWQFWRGGPRWFSAQEFAHLGVEHLLDDLARKIGD
ncbi:MAG TPA: hypothetical protein VN812_11490 [Candidatus Acidoferrales bacterium]|nr:hypothetical protein [Candidatus Acidoferrales bacterium]